MNDNNTGESADNNFSGMLRSQLLATVAVGLAAYAISGKHAGISALAGGLAVLLAAFFASKIAQGKSNNASAILMRMLKAELVKIILIILFLIGIFKGYKELVPGALIAGLAVTAIISGAAISKQSKHLKI
jgi:ATP synthase protein I